MGRQERKEQAMARYMLLTEYDDLGGGADVRRDPDDMTAIWITCGS
jgi:hypothetical protein